MLVTVPTLDLIVTHYKEPWSTGKKFYDMLSLQRGIEFNDVRVIIVQDGDDGALPWKECLNGYPFNFRIKTIPHSGVSCARNAGLEASDAEWIMFCDFDDTFSSIHSLRKFFDAMSDDADMIYSHLHGEVWDDAHKNDMLGIYMDNDTFIHAKMFRRELLTSTGLRFEPGVTFAEDMLFCRVLNIVLNHARKREIPEILYTRCWYEGSVCRSYENNFSNAVGMFKARKALIREYYDHNCIMNYKGQIAKTTFDYYYAIISERYPNKEWFERDFWEFWKEYGDIFEATDRNLIALKKDESHHEAIHKGFAMIESVSFWDWLDQMRKKYDSVIDPEPDTNTLHPRIVVYHGTRNLYRDMVPAVKSLIKNSSVEKVYLLIEDDEFPYDLPDCVETINMTGQKYILPSSPNYNCLWTWMVMLRAAFPKIFPQYDTILSLDVDTICVRNIDDIWNTDLTGYYYAAVRETKPSQIFGTLRTNMGICLLNLKKLRDDGMCDRMLDDLNTVRHSYTEQDVFNDMCEGYIYELPSEYNASAYTARTDLERIVHFAGFRENPSHALIERYVTEPWPDKVVIRKTKATEHNQPHPSVV